MRGVAVSTDTFGTYLYPAILTMASLLLGSAVTLITQWVIKKRRERRISALPERMHDLAIKYEAFNEVRELDGETKDKDNRVKLKNRTFADMQEYTKRMGEKLDRPALGLVDREGYYALLFAAITVAPKRTDGKLILGADSAMLTGNSQHKAVDAVDTLFRHPELVPAQERVALLKWLDAIPNKEASLPERIRWLRGMTRL